LLYIYIKKEIKLFIIKYKFKNINIKKIIKYLKKNTIIEH
jgi:hypothetical protein